LQRIARLFQIDSKNNTHNIIAKTKKYQYQDNNNLHTGNYIMFANKNNI